jgi:hypothetical protein
MTLVLLIAVFLAGCAIGMFVLLVAGIHIEESHMRDSDARRSTRTEIKTRRALGVYVRRPSAPSAPFDPDSDGRSRNA